MHKRAELLRVRRRRAVRDPRRRDGDGRPDLTYQFRFRTELRNDNAFLYNTGPIESLDSENWNRRQFFSVTMVDARGTAKVLAAKLSCPPCNVGPLSIPDYGKLAADAVHQLIDNLAEGRYVI